MTTVGEFNVEEFITTFVTFVDGRYEDHVRAIMTPGAVEMARPMDRPVGNSRQFIIDAHGAAAGGSSVAARDLLGKAVRAADSGSVTPDESEWPIDGPVIGRGHACMWGAIARALSHLQASTWDVVDANRADSWFGAATYIFYWQKEWKMMGRTVQEWAESRRLCRDEESANFLFLAAGCLFAAQGEVERSQLAIGRRDKAGPVDVDSSFFLGRPPTLDEAGTLSSVLGARNTLALYNSVG